MIRNECENFDQLLSIKDELVHEGNITILSCFTIPAWLVNKFCFVHIKWHKIRQISTQEVKRKTFLNKCYTHAAKIYEILTNLGKKYDHVVCSYVPKLCIINEVLNRLVGWHDAAIKESSITTLQAKDLWHPETACALSGVVPKNKINKYLSHEIGYF